MIAQVRRTKSTARLCVEVDGPRFRVRTPEVSTPWLLATPSNRHLTVVWFRLLVEAQGTPCFTLQELAALGGSTNRPAANPHLEDFRQCGEDFRTFGLRQRKVDPAVGEGVFTELRQTPVAGPTALVSRVNGRWGRTDWTAAYMEGALEHISCVPVLRTLRRQLAAGQGHCQAGWLLTEWLEGRSHRRELKRLNKLRLVPQPSSIDG